MSKESRQVESRHQDQRHSSEGLLPLVYDELRKLAAVRLAQESGTQTLQPTALVHEVWLRLTGHNQMAWMNRAHFFGAASEAMRRILIERARRRSREKHGAGVEHLDAVSLDLPAASPDEQLLAVHEALDQFQVQDPEKARVVLLKFFGGLTNTEVAETLGVTARTIERHWAFAKVWLLRAMRRDE